MLSQMSAAFTTSLARPDYYALTPFISVVPDDDSEIAAGNPNLNATFAYNFDLMIEKYYKSVGLLSGGVFYKKLNVIDGKQRKVDFPHISSNWKCNTIRFS